MRSFYFMVNRFADIMKQSGTFCHAYIRSDFSCKKSGKLCYFDRMFQCILSITGTELHTSKKFQKLRMNTMNTNIHSCILTVFTDLCLYFFLCFLYHFFDSCRMDTSVND